MNFCWTTAAPWKLCPRKWRRFLDRKNLVDSERAVDSPSLFWSVFLCFAFVFVNCVFFSPSFVWIFSELWGKSCKTLNESLSFENDQTVCNFWSLLKEFVLFILSTKCLQLSFEDFWLIYGALHGLAPPSCLVVLNWEESGGGHNEGFGGGAVEVFLEDSFWTEVL